MNTQLIETTKKVFDILFWIGVVVGVGVVLFATVAAVAGNVEESGWLIDVRAPSAVNARLLIIGAGVSLVATLGIWLYIAQMIRRALGSILEGSAFRVENYGRIRQIARAIFVLALVEVVTTLWTSVFSIGGFHIDIPIGTLVAGILVLAIAEIYRAGISLQDDAELTV